MSDVPFPTGLVPPALRRVSVRRHRRGDDGRFSHEETEDVLAEEAPLTLVVEGRALAVVMRTPGYERELAAGFLLTEGVIRSASQVFEISLCPSLQAAAAAGSKGEPASEAQPGGDRVEVLLADPSSFDPDKLTRHVFTSSSCGICSKTDLETACPPERILTGTGEPLISAGDFASLPEALRAAQPTFAATGGLHGCAWWNATQRALEPGWIFEDVGRHNALDKLLGHALLTRQLPPPPGVLILSGRLSFELVQKAHLGGIAVIAAVGAPSSLAVAYAQAAGITLGGFVREQRFNLYTHPGRIG